MGALGWDHFKIINENLLRQPPTGKNFFHFFMQCIQASTQTNIGKHIIFWMTYKKSDQITP